MPENKENKSNCHKKWSKRIPHHMIAEVVGTSDSTVKAIRNGQRSNETDLGQQVVVAELLLDEGINLLVAETKRIVQFK